MVKESVLAMGKIFHYFVAIVFAINLFGYANEEKKIVGTSKIFTTEKEVNSVEINESAPMDIIEADFDLGEKSFATDLGNTVYYNIRGLVSVPSEEGKYPVVLIIHGRYNNTSNDTRFDKGFKYLTDYLASYGYAVFTLDIQGAYNKNFGSEDDNKKVRTMFPSFIEAFENANNGILEGFSIDLTDTLDLENIFLIGHSRGGETAIDIALENENIKGVISVAPTLPNELNRKYPDIPISIIVPELDGDVDTLDGFSLFDSITLDKDRRNGANLIFLENANHNWFNSMLTKNDANYLEDEERIKNQIDRETQETFLENFSRDFLDSIFYKDKTTYLNDYSTFEPTYMYGLEVKTQFWRKKQETILDYKNMNNIAYEGVEVDILKEALESKEDEINGFNLPLQNIEGFNYKKLINIKWKNRLGMFEIPTGNINFKKYDSLILNLAVDPSDNLNLKNQSQSFIISLEDGAGNVSQIILDRESQGLDYVEGDNIYSEYEDEIVYYWSGYTVLSDVKIPLEAFIGVDLKNITKISLTFNQRDSGSIMINNIRLS